MSSIATIKRRIRRKGRQINNKKVILLRKQLPVVNKRKKTQKPKKRLSNNFQVVCMVN